MGGSGLKAKVAAAIVVCIWIYNVAFNIPMFMWANVYANNWGGYLTYSCYPRTAVPAYVLAARIINFYVPLAITWTSNVGIIHKLRTTMNKVITCIWSHNSVAVL